MDPLQASSASAINHLLRAAGWARERLKPFAGRSARLEPVPFGFSLTVTETGEVVPAAAEAAPDVTVRLTAGLALRLAARDETAWKDVEITGDTEFAAAINYLARNLRWDLEEDLARVFGDIAAHRMADAGATLSRWSAQAAENFGRSLAEYWTEEQPLIAGAREVEEFNRAVDALRDDVARLENRLDLLDRRDAKRAK